MRGAAPFKADGMLALTCLRLSVVSVLSCRAAVNVDKAAAKVPGGAHAFSFACICCSASCKLIKVCGHRSASLDTDCVRRSDSKTRHCSTGSTVKHDAAMCATWDCKAALDLPLKLAGAVQRIDTFAKEVVLLLFDL